MNTNRKSCLRGAALGSAVVLALSAPAMAADIYDGGLKGGYDVPPPSDRGIYIKGYMGQANTNVGGMDNEVYGTNSTFQIYNHDIKTSTLYGIGLGWQARHWLRFDGTIEYRGDAAFFGADRYVDPGAPSGAATNEYTADVKSWLGLVNAYIDMGNWCGFTPYIGAGIGFSTITVDGLKDVNVPVNGFAYGTTKTSSNFAYAFYAGTSFDVTPQVALDLSYRWANLGSASSGPVSTYLNEYSYAGQQLKDITSNDVMLGVRYKFQREAAVYPIK